MTIVLTVASLDSDAGGTSAAVAALATHIAERGPRVHIVTRASPQPLLSPVEGSVTVRFLPEGPRPFQWVQLWQTLRGVADATEGPLIIHDNGLWLPFNHLVARFARPYGIPRVASPHGMLEPWSLQQGGFKKQLAWHLYQHHDLRSAAAVLATAPQEAHNIRKKINHAPPIAVIPNGVTLNGHFPRAQGPQHAPPDQTTKRTLLFLSRIHPKKGLLYLVEAWNRLRPDGWRVVIAGPDEGGHRREVEEAINASGRQHDFHFTGPVEGEAKWVLYDEADVFVLPTHSENFGIVVAEALVAGTPVITTRGTPWADLVQHRCGWWVDVGVEPLTEALREAVATLPAEREAMGARGRALILDQYTWPQVAREMIEVYEWVLHGGTPPASVTVH